ncbi:MAG: GatB/YqeY domain-containing protein [Gammaproteobacteria bacterium]|nr:GatB/YqeY domain-containing protein [Gammaproteobacteria bacterium]
MSLKTRIEEDMKAAMRAKDKERLGVIRLILAAIKQREVDERITLDDAQALAVLDKMLKQRRDSISQYEAAGRSDLARQEAFEIGVIQVYLPAQLGEAELDALIDQAVTESGAASAKDMGKVMAVLKPRAQGRTDMGAMGAKVKNKLAALFPG